MAFENRQQSKFDAKFKAMFETKDEKFQKLLECLEPLCKNQVQLNVLASFYVRYDVAINVLHEETILEFCRKEDAKHGLYKYVEGLIEFPISANDGDCCVGKKRKDIGSVVGHGEGTSSKRKKSRSTHKK
ncbi:unnamed protein product [Arabis nemorensis]|uniref:Uncharacterized protein n=1 Tax=Arabis nemorensis TaxID=586526 RepID=A0A565BIX7_9BRAS|nr:unnamed protein product [Arabis nemorensis]